MIPLIIYIVWIELKESILKYFQYEFYYNQIQLGTVEVPRDFGPCTFLVLAILMKLFFLDSVRTKFSESEPHSWIQNILILVTYLITIFFYHLIRKIAYSLCIWQLLTSQKNFQINDLSKRSCKHLIFQKDLVIRDISDSFFSMLFELKFWSVS